MLVIEQPEGKIKNVGFSDELVEFMAFNKTELIKNILTNGLSSFYVNFLKKINSN